MVGRMTWVSRIRSWTDLGPTSWQAILGEELGPAAKVIGIEPPTVPSIVKTWLGETYPDARFADAAGSWAPGA